MKRLSILLVLILASCDYFEKNKIDANTIIQEELETINWNEVDVYPTFENCEEASTKSDKKYCFENVLIKHINQNLANQVLVVSESINDTILLTLNCSNTGELTINHLKIKETTRQQIQNIDSIILSGFDSLPKLYPAIKRSQPVATEFKLPIVLKTD